MTSKLERLLHLHWQNDAGEWNDDLQKEYDTLKAEVEHDLKLANELRLTHQFYQKSKNGECAGVTHQILTLSNYGGRDD